MEQAGPATDTLAAHTTQIADLIDKVGDTDGNCSKVPVDRGHRHQRAKRQSPTPTRWPRAWNDVALAPDATLFALNRLMPPFDQIDAEQRDLGAGQHRPAGSGIDPRHRLRRRPRAARAQALQLGAAGRLLQVHAVASAGASRREGTRCSTGPGDTQPDRTGTGRHRSTGTRRAVPPVDPLPVPPNAPPPVAALPAEAP